MNTQRIARIGLFTALGLIMFLIESAFPSLLVFAPGTKMGLSNIVSLLALILLGPLDAYLVLFFRVLIASLFGNFGAIIYSLSGGLVSLTGMVLLYRFVFPKVSILSISILGAFLHNFTQVTVYSFVAESKFVLDYIIFTPVASVIAGLVVGLTTYLIIRLIPANTLLKLTENTQK